MGISPALVARWARHGIKTLLVVYASWIFGEEKVAMDRIAERYEKLPKAADTTEWSVPSQWARIGDNDRVWAILSDHE